MTTQDPLTSFFTYIKQLTGYIVIVSHKNADADAVGSSLGLKWLLQHINPNITVEIIVQSLSKRTIPFCEYINCINQIHIQEQLPKGIDLVILVDANRISLSGFDLPEEIPYIIIDHHYPVEATSENFKSFDRPIINIVDEKVSSTSEIIFTLCESYKIECDIIPERTRWGLLGGIIGDSQRFIHADKNTFQIVAQLMNEDNFSYDDLLGTFFIQTPISERIAKLKASQRLQLQKHKNYIFVKTHVSAFEASAARSLIYQGADLAVVGALKKDETRISIRASRNFSKLNIHVGKNIASKLGKSLNGTGSGHFSAGGVNTNEALSKKEFNSIVDKLFSEIEANIESSILHSEKDNY